MNTNKMPATLPITIEERMAIERAARAERGRAMAAFARSVFAAVRRVFGHGKPTTIYVPSVRGRITA
ncbi:MAG: RSP_7527 family protein [Acetobacteraceae bacterium]